MNIKPIISILIPCRNEGKFIKRCLDSIIVQNYPKEKLEVLIIDGMSEDETREILNSYIQKLPYVKLMDNPKKITPTALNIGLEKSKGDFILWMSAHNEYKKDYISKCEQYLSSFNADAVGGIVKICPRKNNIVEKLICTALSHPFGVGKSIHKIGSKYPRWTDTAFGVCYKKDIFEKVGKFNENLVRGQDMEFNMRLKKKGFKILLAPDIVSYYYPRSDLISFLSHNLKNGLWSILPFKYTKIMPVSWRHLIPLTFVSVLIIFAALSFISSIFLWLFLITIGLYFLCNIYFSIIISLKEKNLISILIAPAIFTLLHLTYGLGSLWGLSKVLLSKQFWENRFGK